MISTARGVAEAREMLVDGDRIPYRLLRSGRRTLEISVAAGGLVEVRAPAASPIERIEQRLRARAGWIRRKVVDRAKWPVCEPPRRYESGESHRYLGRQYRLRVVDGEGGVRLMNGRILVAVAATGGRRAVARALRTWLARRARIVLPDRAAALMARAEYVGLTAAGVTVRSMRTRWGSCSASGRLLLNTSLITLPTSLIDYVIAHELCHLRVANHGEAFDRLLTRLMPDWRQRHEKLASHVE